MTKLILIAAALAAFGCAGPQRSTMAVRYVCGDRTVVRSGESLTVDVLRSGTSTVLAPTQLGWTDDGADHFVTWPQATTDVEAVEYVVPHDRRKDAVEKRYDSSAGYSSSDWRLLEKRACRAEGGYNDALARWMSGDSLEKVAKDLSVDRGSARTLVRKALSQLQKQYISDR